MKIKYYLFVPLCILTLCLSACSNDDETGNANAFVGQWSLIEETGYDYNGTPYTDTYPKGEDILVLEKDGTAYSITKDYDGSIDNGKGIDNYRWKVKNDKFLIDYNDGDGWMELTVKKITADKMVLEFIDTEGQFDGEHTISTFERM